MTDEHPNADDYRNRAERAEQALTELAGHDGLSLAVALMRAKQQLDTERANADMLAEFIYEAIPLLEFDGQRAVADDCRQALAAHQKLRG